MPAGVVADPDPKSEGQLRREAATAQLHAEQAENAEDDEQPRPILAAGLEETGGFGQDSEDGAHGEAQSSEAEA